MRPEDLVLRCYGYRKRSGAWYAVCVDLNVDAEGPSAEQARQSLEDAIIGYLETVVETKDRPSLASLLRRRAPLKDRLLYYAVASIHRVIGALRAYVIAFQETIPIQLAVRSCA